MPVLIVELLIRIRVFDKFYREGWRVALVIFFGILTLIIVLSITFSDSLGAAKDELMFRNDINKLVGGIKEFGWLTTGSISIHKSDNEYSEYATFEIIVKGKESFAEVTVTIQRTNDEPWEFKILKISE